MVAIKSFAISTICVLSMVGMSVQEDALGNFINTAVWPLAFIKNCKLQADAIDALNNVLRVYYLNGYGCTDSQKAAINTQQKCPVDVINLIAGVSWPTEFQRQTDLNKKIYAQSNCINMLTNGVKYDTSNPDFDA